MNPIQLLNQHHHEHAPCRSKLATNNESSLYSGRIRLLNRWRRSMAIIFSVLLIPITVHAAPAGLVSSWKGENNANDSIDGNNGMLVGSVTFEPGKVGQAFKLNRASSSYIDFGNAPNLQVSSGDFTVATWVNFTSHIPSHYWDMSIVDKMHMISAPNDDGWRLARQFNNHFWFCFGGGPGVNGCTGGPPNTIQSTTSVTPGAWYHVVAMKAGGTISLYINGVLEASTVLGYFHDTNSSNLRVGAYPSESFAFMDGAVDEVQLYNRALTSTEVQSLMISSYPFDGFFQPIDNAPVLNIVKAGSSIPVKFSLGGDQGLNIFAPGSPTSAVVTCPGGGAQTDPIEETTNSNSGLSYDAISNQYQYVWKTDKAWANTCRQLSLRLNDGTEHIALFQFAR